MADLHFTREEYERRVNLIKGRMAARGIDVLVITEPSNMYYATGYDAYSFYVVQAVLIALDSGMPLWTGRFMDATSATRTTYLPEEWIRPYPDYYVQSADRHPMQFIAALIEEKGWAKGVIGVEMGAYYYTARSHSELVAALPSARFRDAELLVNEVRLVKSEQELAYMRQAGVISERMMLRAVELAAPGVRECDVAGAVYEAQMRGTEEFGGLPSTSPPYLCCGNRVIEPHAAWSDAPLQIDSPINLELSGCRLRYHAPLSRTIYLGRPPQSYADLAARVVDGLEAALTAVKPGITGEEVEAVWRKTMARWGIEKEARLGYSIGIGYAPTWGERTASLRKGDRTVLQAGMAFHMMAGLWLHATGVTITQSFAVTPNGQEPLTALPRKLVVKG
jgi:Xaa-Pro aminopeptidase